MTHEQVIPSQDKNQLIAELLAPGVEPQDLVTRR